MTFNPNQILNRINKQTKRQVSAQDIQKMAKQVKPSTMSDEKQLRELVKNIGGMAGLQVPEKTVNDIVKIVQSNKGNLGNVEQLMKNMMGPK
jgi:cell division protein FtsX